MPRPRALCLTPIPPSLDSGGGGEIRQAHLLAALTERFDVDLLLAGRLEDDRLRARLAGVHELAPNGYVDPSAKLRRRLRDLRWQLVERQPDEVARYRETRRALARAIPQLPAYDLVCVEYVSLAPLLPPRRSQPWVLTLHNLTSAMARHKATIAPGRRQRLMLALEERNSRAIERWAAFSYDLVVSPSGEDAATLGKGVEVVPNGVELDRFATGPLPEAAQVVFTGALHTLPNRDGILWFCAEVWPLIRARLPEARLDIVGSRPPAEILALGQLPGVSVHPDVPDVVPYLDRSRVAIVPLRIGSGSRLKALEAMAAGRPVVGTAIGLGGLDATPGVQACLADDPPGFAEAVARLLSDTERAAALARRGRALAAEKYSWTRIGDLYADRLERLVAAYSTPEA